MRALPRLNSVGGASENTLDGAQLEVLIEQQREATRGGLRKKA